RDWSSDVCSSDLSPAILGHLDVIKDRPAAWVYTDGSAQVYLGVLKSFRTGLFPPVKIIGLPGFQGPLQLTVVAQVDVVGNLVVVIDFHISGSANGFAFAHDVLPWGVRHPEILSASAGGPALG